MVKEIKEYKGFRFIETSPGKPVLLLLHGLFGALSNFEQLINFFSKDYNVVVPMLPIYELDIKATGLEGLLVFTEEFVDVMNYKHVHILGNSLGGHIAQLYVLAHPEKIITMTLTGSSGLFESGMGDGYPRRGDKEYIARKVSETFFDPSVASEALVEEVFDTVNNREKALRIVLTAKSALKHNLGEDLHQITCPTLLVWGKQDTITPPFVGEKFHELISGSELVFIDRCGHAPMMEVPEQFNKILSNFLSRNTV